ncbi:MAG: hypothetical protein LBJ64_13165 [Deltaproteobacteria bacterium]|nr:hypothetical protein [Deltaproteobacteria bacterium]
MARLTAWRRAWTLAPAAGLGLAGPARRTRPLARGSLGAAPDPPTFLASERRQRQDLAARTEAGTPLGAPEIARETIFAELIHA